MVELGLRMGGFLFLYRQAYLNEGKFATDPDVVILALGESTTALGGRQSYPSQLEDVLTQRDPGTNYVVLNRGIPGANSNQIIDWRLHELERLKPDIVVAMMGLNDTAWPPNIEDRPRWDRAVRSFRTYEAAELILNEIRRKREAEPTAETEEIPRPWRNRSSDDGDLLCHGLLIIQSDYAPVIVLCMDALRINPRSSTAYLVMTRGLEEIGRTSEALAMYHKGMSNSADPIIELQYARFIEMQGAEPTAEYLYGKVLFQYPGHPLARYRLASLLEAQGRIEEAEFLLSLSTESSSWSLDESDSAGQCVARWMTRMGLHPDLVALDLEDLQVRIQQQIGDTSLAEQVLVRGLEEGRQRQVRGHQEKCLEYRALVDFYARERRYQEIDALWTTIGREPPGLSACTREVFGRFFLTTGQSERARDVFDPDHYYGPQTAGNYRRLLEATRAIGAILVCVQYPGRSIEPLENMLPGEADVVYVDNGPLFREALEEYEYTELFYDRCYLDFGHGTGFGNRLLAESVADVLLEEVLPR